MHLETEILHTLPANKETGAIATPIYQTSTFVQQGPGEHLGFDYSRSNNPTRQQLEILIAKLEGGSAGFAFASGLAAISTIIQLLQSGDEIICVDDVYGGTFRAFTHIYDKFGIQVRYVDTTEIKEVEKSITNKTAMVWLESPTNPTLKICDIAGICSLAKKHNALSVVDNTFASPVLQRPLDLGTDIVIHSATKYLAGHSDVIAGLVVTNDEKLAEKIKFTQNTNGGILAPFDSWLTIRGIATLTLRVEKQSENAKKVAEFLTSCKEVEKVFYPGLPSHKNHTMAVQQQRGYFGGVVSFSLKKDTEESATKFVKATSLFKLAESLGGVKSLICHPAKMTHKSTPIEIRHSVGIQNSLIRLSCGIEHSDDLIADLKQAFNQV